MSVKISGIETVQKHLDSLANNLPEKIRIFLEKLANIGVTVAQVDFAMAGTDDEPVDVFSEWENDKTINIVAAGISVTFLEFGTGVYNPTYPDTNLIRELGFDRGEYGQGKGKRPFWYYYNSEGKAVRSYGNAPVRGMYDAGKYMRKQIQEIANEVFSHD